MRSDLIKVVLEDIKSKDYIYEELDSRFEPIRPMIDGLCERIQNEMKKEDILSLWNEVHWYDLTKICTKEEFISENTMRKIHPHDVVEYMRRASEGYWEYDDEYTFLLDDYEICSSNLDELFLFDDEVFKGIIYRFVNHNDFEGFFHFNEPTSGDFEEDLRTNTRIKSFVNEDLVEPVIRVAIAIGDILENN